MRNFFASIGSSSTNKINEMVKKELRVTVAGTEGSKAQAGARQVATCGGLLVTFGQTAELFGAFDRTLKRFLAVRTPQLTRLPGIDPGGFDGGVKATTHLHPCKNLFNPPATSSETAVCKKTWSAEAGATQYVCSKAKDQQSLWTYDKK